MQHVLWSHPAPSFHCPQHIDLLVYMKPSHPNVLSDCIWLNSSDSIDGVHSLCKKAEMVLFNDGRPHSKAFTVSSSEFPSCVPLVFHSWSASLHLCRMTYWRPTAASLLCALWFSSRYWACPVASWRPCPAAVPSSARRNPSASETGSRSSPVLSAGPEWSGRWGYSVATGNCLLNVEGNPSGVASCAFGCWGCRCCCCCFCLGDCGPSSGGLWAGTCLSPECPSSSCRYSDTKRDGFSNRHRK